MTTVPNPGATGEQAVSLDRLKSIGFSIPSTQVYRRLILGVQARDKRGKTTFALGAIPPVIHIDTDIGTEGVIQKFSQNGDVLHWEVDVSDRSGSLGERKERFNALWEEVQDKAYAAYTELQQIGQGTLVFDTATEMDQLNRLAHFGYTGQLSQGDRQNFDVVNSDWRSLITRAYKASKVSTIYICHMREVFNQKGTWERAGVSKLENAVQALIQLEREDGFRPPKFSALVLNCRQNIGLVGRRLVEGAPRDPAADVPVGVTFEALLGLVHG